MTSSINYKLIVDTEFCRDGAPCSHHITLTTLEGRVIRCQLDGRHILALATGTAPKAIKCNYTTAEGELAWAIGSEAFKKIITHFGKHKPTLSAGEIVSRLLKAS